MGVTVVTSDATIKVNTSQRVVAPIGWDDQVAEYGRGFNYPPPTGQESVIPSDDGDIEDTIFAPIRVANSLRVQNSLVDFFTLGNTNSFGNTDRLTDTDGLQVYGDDLVIDNYTGLMWYRALITGMNWNDSIDFALASSQGGFTNWFIPSAKQWISIFNYGQSNSVAVDYPPFNISNTTTWSSTTLEALDTNAFYVGTFQRLLTSLKTTATFDIILCRLHLFENVFEDTFDDTFN